MANEATCKTCPWWIDMRPDGWTSGECRAKAPAGGGFPRVAPDKWCAEHPERGSRYRAFMARHPEAVEVHGSKPSAIREHE